MPRFPSLRTLPLPLDPTGFSAALERAIAEPAGAEGYARLTTSEGESYLFVHAGKAHAAGKFEEGRFVSCRIVDFFESIQRCRTAEYACVDAVLLVSVAVAFRKAPAAQIAVGSLGADGLLAAVKQTSKDAVLSFARGDARSLIPCRAGVPFAVFPAHGEFFPAAPTVPERVLAFARNHPDAVVDLYDEIGLPAAPGAGQPFAKYLEETRAQSFIPAGMAPALTVKMGERVVFRYTVAADEVSVGRGGDADLQLDNLSVSRKHAIIRRRGDRLLFEDVGSDNGIVLKGKKVRHADLAVGESVDVGKYTLVYAHYGNITDALHNPVAKASAQTEGADTLFVPPTNLSAPVLEHGGRSVKMAGMVFHIGKAPDAHLKIEGVFVAPLHVRIFKEPNGSYRATHMGGWKAMKVNGKKTKEAVLSPGDVITIGKERIVFTRAQTGAATQLGKK